MKYFTVPEMLFYVTLIAKNKVVLYKHSLSYFHLFHRSQCFISQSNFPTNISKSNTSTHQRVLTKHLITDSNTENNKTTIMSLFQSFSQNKFESFIKQNQ